MRDVTDATFEAEVLGAAGPVVVDFWAPWCVPCKAVARALEELAGGTERVEFVRLDVDASPGVAARYDVLSLPTVILFSGGEAREVVVGARPRKHFEKRFASYL